MAKIILSDLANLTNQTTAVTTINNNNTAIENAMENTLSRDGTSPNTMNADLDMNSNQILNLPDATTDQEPVTYGQFTDAITAIGDGAVVNASYVTLGTNSTLLSERVLTAGSDISITDAGAGSTVTIAVSDPELLALATTTSAADKVPYYTGAGTATTADFTAFARTLVDDADATAARATLGSVIGTNVQAYDADLDAVAGLSTTGLIARTGAGTAATRTLTAPAAGITVTNGDGVAGNPTLGLANDLSAYEGLSTTGVVVRTGDGTATTRTITGTANEITLTNGDGVSGNPTVSIPTAVTFTGKTITGGTYSSPTITTPTVTVNDNSWTMRDNADTTKQLQFEVSGVSTGTTRTLTVPNASTTIVGTDATQTLTNKTISGASNTLSNVALSSLANQAAYTFVGNNSGSSAAPTAVDIAALTTKASPAVSDYLLLSDQAASGAWKKALVSGISGAGSVSSIAGNTGAFTLAGGVTNSTNQIQLDGAYTGFAIANGTLAISAAGSALTIALKDNAGSDPSATSPVFFNFPNVTGTTGSTSLVSVTGASSLVISSGSTLGVTSSTAFRLWVVGFNDGGTFRLGVINCATKSASAPRIFPLNAFGIASSTAEGGAGAADSAGVFYTGTAVTSKAFRILGYIEWSSSGLTAGTWTTTNLLYVRPYSLDVRLPGSYLQWVLVQNSTASNTTSSSFQNSNLTTSITPTSAANFIHGEFTGSIEIASDASVCYFQLYNSTSAAGHCIVNAGGTSSSVTRDYCVNGCGLDSTHNSTSAQTYVIRYRNTNGTTRVDYTANGASDVDVLILREVMA